MALVGVWAVAFWRLMTPPPRLPISHTWSSGSGVYLFTPEGVTRNYVLPTRSKKAPKDEWAYPLLSGDNGALFYWSSEDHAIAGIRPGGALGWFDIPKPLLKKGWSVDSVQVFGGSYVLLNTVGSDYQPSGVVLLNTDTRRCSLLRDAIQARADSRPGSDMVALLKSDGSIFIHKLSDGTESRFAALPEKLLRKDRLFGDWTVDFASQTLFYTVSHQVTATNPSTNETRQVNLPHRSGSGVGIVWHPAMGELWVSVTGTWSMTGIVVYSQDLKFVGGVDVGCTPDPHPVPMTNETIDLLSKVAVKVEPVPRLDKALNR